MLRLLPVEKYPGIHDKDRSYAREIEVVQTPKERQAGSHPRRFQISTNHEGHELIKSKAAPHQHT